MGRILINYLVVVSLLLGFAPLGVVFFHDLSERSTDPEIPAEREEAAAARSSIARQASKRGGKFSPVDLPGSMIIGAARRSVSSPTLPLATFTISPPHPHPLSGVRRI